jgi:hypothetical protein
MKFLHAMTIYFQGERTEALVFILPLGLLSLVFGGWLLSEGTAGFARGLAIPFVVMGLVMAVVGGVVGFRTPAQVDALEAAIASEPTAALRDERVRMEKVNRAWPVYLAVWAAFGVIGLALRFATKADFSQGLGIGLVFFCGVCLLIDGFAERRARPYMEAIDAALAGASTAPSGP